MLRIAGVELRFGGDLEPHLDHLAGVGPFREPAPCDRVVHIELGGVPDVVGTDEFSLVRQDFDFHIDAQRRRVRARSGGSAAALEAIIDLTLQTVLLRDGGCVLHAAGGVYEGAGWLLPGPSGTGKSTSARGGFDIVLSDERIALRPDAGGYRIYGTPIWSEGRELPLSADSAPLCVLARPAKSDAVRVEPLAPADAAAWLLRSVVIYETSPLARHAAFEVACDVAEAVRCAELSFPKGRPWLSAATSAISRDPSTTPPTRTSPSRSNGT